ncbi:MAG: hypothetical protein A3F72_07550 [Bacteroidetes bacterium RIFCSPLOWO2_12_FULL_35_15]|nr:MAG: hypothetical protein A3F72_07550 [Bacteroidetes bacterium RIFCSPLOWO2_12_FULL_35_15]
MKTKTKLFSIAFIAILAFASCMKEPMACCDVPTTGTIGQSVSFSSSCSIDASKYEWNFGDGSAVSTEATATHIYTTAGTYTVKLMAMSKNEKKMSETTKTITIN